MPSRGSKTLVLIDTTRTEAKLMIDGTVVLPGPYKYTYLYQHNHAGHHEFTIEILEGDKLEILWAEYGSIDDYYHCKRPEIIFVNDKVSKIKTECAEREIHAGIRIHGLPYKGRMDKAKEERWIRKIVEESKEEQPAQEVQPDVVSPLLILGGLGLLSYYLLRKRR